VPAAPNAPYGSLAAGAGTAEPTGARYDDATGPSTGNAGPKSREAGDPSPTFESSRARDPVATCTGKLHFGRRTCGPVGARVTAAAPRDQTLDRERTARATGAGSRDIVR